ncbi:TPA: peptide chain release factor 2 [Candidatus Saccharibacteria bacterium]|nr:MAG: peptide chain release factor 2 [Candidatus Saccharibacteria bacterium RIFCSPHIGHO2_12_FULL_47_17]HCM52234.1 peptide chain release factor 2 [Candidatus Saccharibacteria bacterium]
MEELKKRADELERGLNQALAKLRFEELEQELKSLNNQMAEAGFWQDAKKAQATARRAGDLSRRLEPWQKLASDLKAIQELLATKDPTIVGELTLQLDGLEKQLSELQTELKFQGPYDDHDVIINIYAGAGGTDAQDWTEMLLRMYVRWAESQNLSIKTVDQSPGEEAGLKSVTIEFSGGDFLYGKLVGEHGVHRLVRQSPFNADHKRQTSFAKVEILPLIDRSDKVEIDPKDLKIDVFRASGKGGQSVNTTDSAVRITHLPTSISVAIQTERSQLQNKQTALSILRSKLVQLSLEQHADNLSQLKGPSQSAEWGNQIRNYVLHPYKQVKDLRTGFETSNPEKILDGDLEPLIDAWLDKAA